MEQISYDEGSGGYHRPCSAAAALTSTFNAPGLDDRDLAGGVDLDRAHPVQGDRDAAVDGRGPAGQPGAGAARHDRDPVLGGPPHGLLHLRRGLGTHHRDRRAGRAVPREVLAVLVDLRGTGRHDAVGKIGDQPG